MIRSIQCFEGRFWRCRPHCRRRVYGWVPVPRILGHCAAKA